MNDMTASDLIIETLKLRREQAQLLVLRYWYHRAVNPATAKMWADKMLTLVDQSQHEIVVTSIAEVDEIE